MDVGQNILQAIGVSCMTIAVILVYIFTSGRPASHINLTFE